MTPLRIGLIGCGEIGGLRAAALTRQPATRLAAVSDREGARARALATRYRTRAEPDWRDLLRRDDIDAVVVSTWPDSHAEIAVAAIEAGRHVLCEKPLARSAGEARQILAAAAAAGRVVATGFNFRFFPSVAKARTLLRAGLVGDLDHVRAYAGYADVAAAPAWIRDAGVVGGGALRDIGSHLIDLTRHFLGEVREVAGAVSGAARGLPGLEDNGFALLRTAAGRVAILQASWTEWQGYRFRLELYGTRGCVTLSCFPMLTTLMVAGGRRRRYLFPLSHVRERLGTHRGLVGRSFVDELDAFARAVAGLPTEAATGADGLRALEIAEAIGAGPGRELRAASLPG